MGSRKWHLARADHHKKVADFLAPHHEDWAAVALAYSALHYVHSTLADEPAVAKDERHPRKHTAPAGAANGGRGTNQMVRDFFPAEVHVAYMSLFDMGRRTRYDMQALGPQAYKLLLIQFETVKKYCIAMNGTRPVLPTQTP